MKQCLKALAFALAWLMVLPFTALARLEGRTGTSEEWFLLGAQFLAAVPGFPGRWLRGAFYFSTLEVCSWEIHIGFGSMFTHRAASVGRRVSMGNYCVLGQTDIQSDVRIASRVSVPSGRRQHLDDSGEVADVTVFARVRIGMGSWIGEGAIVLDDVGVQCIIAAGAVVTRPVADNLTVAGNPARPLQSQATDAAGRLP